jgi:GT2 family glycosyltransferase
MRAKRIICRMQVDVSVVTFRTPAASLHALAASLAEQSVAAKLSIHFFDNSESADIVRTVCGELAAAGRFAAVTFTHSPANVGFGRGHNANARQGSAPYLFVLNPDCVVEPHALDRLVQRAQGDAAAAAWEMRQIPYEHPKIYDPVTLETVWVSGAATLFRRSDFDAVGGFDDRIFLYGEDVDLSWRLRARGQKLRYVPTAAVVHETYAQPEEVKPQQAFGAVYAGLALRTRFGRVRSVVKGLLMWGAEMLLPESFPGRRRGIFQAGMRYLRDMPYFVRTRVPANAHFGPQFSGWSYEHRRDGAFHAMRSHRGRAAGDFPLVSILVRTYDRPAWLREALVSCEHQTYPNLEVVVVQDGPGASEAVAREFEGRLRITYVATPGEVGRARAGNIAMERAKGEWLNFLDDDDVLFADHVEVLVDAVRASGAPGAFAYAWETATQVVDRDRAVYREIENVPRHRPQFDLARLWRQNFLPIQAVLFHRGLFEREGGFAEDMDQLEDWNLWTRYTLERDFVAVPKTTSKYRVPDSMREAVRRQALLDAAYPSALARQQALRTRLSPARLSQVDAPRRIERLPRSAARAYARRMIASSRTLAAVAAWRHPAKAWLRRRRIWS